MLLGAPLLLEQAPGAFWLPAVRNLGTRLAGEIEAALAEPPAFALAGAAVAAAGAARHAAATGRALAHAPRGSEVWPAGAEAAQIGDVGVALLAADLARPERAAMPLWRAVPAGD